MDGIRAIIGQSGLGLGQRLFVMSRADLESCAQAIYVQFIALQRGFD